MRSKRPHRVWMNWYCTGVGVTPSKNDRVVLDTAPTGHTLRLLALPELLDDFAERAAAARDRLKRTPLAPLSSLSSGVDDSIEEARDRVRELQDDAFAMDAVLKNADRCEFVMVAAPTDLSLTETDDLKRSLDESGVKAQRLVVNGILDEAACKNFASSSLQTQRENLEALDAFLLAILLERRVDGDHSPPLSLHTQQGRCSRCRAVANDDPDHRLVAQLYNALKVHSDGIQARHALGDLLGVREQVHRQ